jgi:beta-xylosidase
VSKRWRWVIGGAAALGAIAILVDSTVTDLGAHARSRRAHQTLVVAERNLKDAGRVGAVTTAAGAGASTHQQALLHDVTFTLDVLAHTELTYSGTTQAVYLQGLDIGVLHTCLGGVQNALTQIAAHNNPAAANDISAVSAACLNLRGGSSSGLVYPFDFPDPFVLTVGTTYFAYGTNSVEGNIGIIESTDLVHWSVVGNALPSLPTWATPGSTWAPAVIPIGGQYVLYYSTVATSTGQQCISEATSAQPQGPYVDTSTGPMVCQTNLGGSIDPSPFVDVNGTPYLLWKSIGVDGQSDEIWSQQLNPAGTAVMGTGPTAILAATQGWEDHNVEAPDLIALAGRYFLFYSGNSWTGPNYAVGVALCAGPLGPCAKPLSQPILASGTGMLGPGGESVFADSAGQFWIAFHAWAPGAVGYPNSRALYIRPLSFSSSLPVVEPAQS